MSILSQFLLNASFPSLSRFVEIFSTDLPVLEPLLKEAPQLQRSFTITQIALNNSSQEILKAHRFAKHMLRQQEALHMAGRIDISLANIQHLRHQIQSLSQAYREQKIFYQEITWKGMKREILFLQNKGAFTPPQKKLIVQVSQTFKKLFRHYSPQKILFKEFVHFHKKHVLPLEDRIVRTQWRKKFRSVARLAAKQAPVWSLYHKHREFIQNYVKTKSFRNYKNSAQEIFLKTIPLKQLSEDEFHASALFDFVSKQGMVPHFFYRQKKSMVLLKPFIENMRLFFNLAREQKLDSVLSNLSAESEFLAIFSLFLQMQDLHSLNVGFVPSLKQKNSFEVVLFDGGVCLGESNRIQSFQVSKKIHHIHPLRCCFLENASFANRRLRNSTLDRILQIDVSPIAAWMDRRDAPIHGPLLKQKKKSLKKKFSFNPLNISLSDIRKETKYNHSILTLAHFLDEQNIKESDSEKNLLKQLLPRVSPLQKKSFFVRMDYARAYIRLWRSFSRSQTASLDTHALLFYIRHPRLPFHTMQRCRLEHLVIQKYHTETQKNLLSILQEIKQAIEPTFFHLACVLYPDLADFSQIMVKLNKTTEVAMGRLGDFSHPLEADLQAIQKQFPRSEEAQLAAWIQYRLLRNRKKIFWACWRE